MTVIVNAPRRIRARIEVPSDKSISHRSLIFNAVAQGDASIERILDSEDVRSTAACLRALGVEIDWPEGSSQARVSGRGMHSLFEAEDLLNCGNSGTSMRLLTGLLAGQPIFSVLTGDASLRTRPMARVINPLRSMGANINGRQGDTLAPIAIRGGSLHPIDYRSPVASAQVKSAIMLAGLYAPGATTVTEPEKSRDHTERMLSAMGVEIGEHGTVTTLTPPAHLEPLSMRVPGDISSAAPWLVLGACHSDAEIVLQGVNVNPTRTGILDVLEAMGASVERLEERVSGGEPTADLVVRTSQLRATTVAGSLVPRAIDELPLVAILGCFAEGETVVANAEELVVKESDRVAATVEVLTHMGARITPRADGFVVHGPTKLSGASLNGRGDHRIGMLGAIAGALANGETRIDDDAVGVSYPNFWQDLARAAEGGMITA
ncbi:MAG: 3-phosphoshikimate 1-carboxyvinyltransferase [Dehalococcoidia bacterium]